MSADSNQHRWCDAMTVKISALVKIVMLASLLVACSSTSTPDLKLIMMLHCGEDNDACSIQEDNLCEGRGRWNQFRDHNEVIVNDNSDKLIKRQDLGMGTFDDINGTCMFSETISMKSSSRYRIYIDDHGPFDVLKSTLEDQNWTLVLNFND